MSDTFSRGPSPEPRSPEPGDSPVEVLHFPPLLYIFRVIWVILQLFVYRYFVQGSDMGDSDSEGLYGGDDVDVTDMAKGPILPLPRPPASSPSVGSDGGGGGGGDGGDGGGGDCILLNPPPQMQHISIELKESLS